MRTLHISVLDKKATYASRDGDIVCGNSDYVIQFSFDAEWDGYTEKVARFIWNGQYKDVTFTGASCAAPIITNATEVEVGVYAGELSTTTPAVIGCQKSILCESAPPSGIPFTKGEKGDPGVGVPEVTADDNGKVLTVQDGDTVWAEPTGGGGDSLPEVTEDDNGKILIVQNGKWVIDNYGNIRETLEITLKATDWADNKQTIESASISENCTLVASPTTESTEAYIASGIMLTEAEVGKMVFECVVPPTEDIAVLVHIIDPLITAESTEILTFDSVDEMNAYEAEDGAIAIVPSELVQADYEQNDSTQPDYIKNRAFYSEPELLLENEVTTSEQHVCSTVIELVEGNAYKVIVDGVEYVRTAYTSAGVVVVGNLILGGTDPFTIGNEDGMTVFVTSVVGATFTMYSLTVHKLDPIYLPGAYLPLVILETTYEQGASLTEADNAKLSDCVGYPCVIKIPYGDYSLTGVADYNTCANSGKPMFELRCMTTFIAIYSEDGISWKYAT